MTRIPDYDSENIQESITYLNARVASAIADKVRAERNLSERHGVVIWNAVYDALLAGTDNGHAIDVLDIARKSADGLTPEGK